MDTPKTMRTILITRPDFFNGESEMIAQMFEAGLPLLHIRKPQAGAEEMEAFIRSLPCEYRHKMVLHSHYSLIPELGLRGAHLGRGRTLPPDFPTDIPTSFSCHSLDEVAAEKERRVYVFLSPIFSSISKKGYDSAFSQSSLEEAHQRGIIDNKVIALGGIAPPRLPLIKALGFGGAALLGAVWQSPNPVTELRKALYSP